MTCATDVLVRPNSTAELAAAAADLAARAAAEGRPLKMRASRDGFGSMPSFPCAAMPEDPAGKAGAGGGAGPAPLVAGLLLDKASGGARLCASTGRFLG